MRKFGRKISGMSCALVLFALAACSPSLTPEEEAAAQRSAENMAMLETYGVEALSAGWIYRSDMDEMRGQKEEFASLNSRRPDQRSPSTSRLVIGRKNGKQWINLVMLGAVGPGGFLPTCNDGNLSAKFDDGAIQTVSCNDGSAAGVGIDTAILPALRKGKILTIEVEDEWQIKRQIIFDIAGLKL